MHPVAARPGRLSRVHVESGAQAEIIVVAFARNLQAARAGIRDDDGEPQLRSDALRARLDDEILFRAGEAREPVEHRPLARFRLRRKKHAEAHDASGFTRLVAVDALDAAEAFIAGNGGDRHLRAARACVRLGNQYTTTERIDLPSCIRSNPWLMSA